MKPRIMKTVHNIIYSMNATKRSAAFTDNSRSAGFTDNSRSAGFTMIEMAMVIAIIGIVISGAAFAYPRYVHQQQVASTTRQLDTIMTILSAYVQRHNRLPCPARTTGDGLEHKTVATAAGPNTSCYDNTDIDTYFENATGILPWRELGIPESMTRDAWGRLITYKPAAQLTLDTSDPRMQDLTNNEPMGIHNACRSPMWYTLDGSGRPVHTRRAQALFCCNAQPKPAYKPGGGPVDWRMQTLRAAGQAQTMSAVQSPAWMDKSPYDADSDWTEGAEDYNGSFGAPRLSGFGGQVDALPDSPLIRASTNAVTLISHGGNGFLAYIFGSEDLAMDGDSDINGDEADNVWDVYTQGMIYNSKLSFFAYDKTGQNRGLTDDIVTYLRSDQLYAKAGKASCMPNNITHNCAPVETSEAKATKDVSYILDKSSSMEDIIDCQPGSAYCGWSLNAIVDDAVNRIIPKMVEMKLQSDPTASDIVRLSTLWNAQAPIAIDPGQGLGSITYDAGGNYTGTNTTVAALQAQIGNLTTSGGSPVAQSVLNMVQNMGNSTDPEKPNVIVLMSDGSNNENLTLPCGSCPGGTVTYVMNDSNDATHDATNTTIMNALADYLVANFPGVQIYSIQIAEMNGSGTNADKENMRMLAERTGGRYIPVSYPDDLKDVFDSIMYETSMTCL